VHVLVEKPLAADTASATRIADVVKQAGIVAMVGHIERFNPALVEMRKLLDTNTLGELFAFTARRIGPFPPRVKDVGVTHDIATHDLDQARHVLRKPMTTLFARSARRVHEEREDLISIVGSTDDGVVLTFEVNWLTPRKQRETVVLGENGMLLADTIAQDLFFFRNNWQEGTWLQVLRGVDEGDMTRYALKRTEPLRAELTAFATAVRSGSAIEPTVEDGLAAIQLADAVLRSSQSGRPWHAWTKEL